MTDVRAAVLSVIGNKGDEAVLDYVIGSLEDEDFEWGEDGSEAFEVFGEMLVRIWVQCRKPRSPHASPAPPVLPHPPPAASRPAASRQ